MNIFMENTDDQGPSLLETSFERSCSRKQNLIGAGAPSPIEDRIIQVA
jgi:hypothetical protein